MRAILVAMHTAMGIGLMGTAGSTAAPISGSSLLNALEDLSAFEQVQRGNGRGGNGFRGGVVRGGSFRSGRVGGGRYWRGGRWWYYGGCSYEFWVLGLCY
jgi:hypothetical protein